MGARFLDFDTDPVTLARRLLGQRLVRIEGGTRLAGRIVEVEAYLGAKDRAAHTYGGRRTARNESMYLDAGHLYVYFTYGMHYCMNIVCGERDEGVAVLLRAVEPTEGLERMYERRVAAKRDRDLCSGPAKLTQAFGIDRSMDGLDLKTSREVFLEGAAGSDSPPLAERHILRSPRIGVDYAGAWAKRLLRFSIRGNEHVSRAR